MPPVAEIVDSGAIWSERQIASQPGPQTEFATSEADIVVYGGTAGGGKTYSLLLDPLRHVHRPGFGAVLFRRTFPEISKVGGMWDESTEIYPHFGGVIKEQYKQWVFPSGATVSFSHLQHEKDKQSWLGAQIPYLGFDQVEGFTAGQFWFLQARCRTMCGMRPCIRMSCNPDADSWVAKFIDWWIDKDGYPIPERSGEVRWFVRDGNELVWADDPETLTTRFKNQRPMSLTFIPSKLSDNPKLTDADPGYLAKLLALPTVERERLLGGNWKIKPAAGLVYNPVALRNALVGAVPHDMEARVRGWDLAATAAGENYGDYTVGLLMGRKQGVYYVMDVVRGQWGPDERDRVIVDTARQDKAQWPLHPPEQAFPQDPAQAGKSQANQLIRLMAGMPCHTEPVSGNKIVRAGPVASQIGAGNVKILRGDWADALLGELGAFPEGGKDDQSDSLATAFSRLADHTVLWLAPPKLEVAVNLRAPMAHATRRKLFGLE